MKYVLTQQAIDFICSVVKSPERAKEIIEKTELVFNNEQKEAYFTLGELKVNGWTCGIAHISIERFNNTVEVEDWALTSEEINSIGAEEKLDA